MALRSTKYEICKGESNSKNEFSETTNMSHRKAIAITSAVWQKDSGHQIPCGMIRSTRYVLPN
jgi:hypothetical protein